MDQTSRESSVASQRATVGPKESLGAGIIGLGILALLLPWAANAIADLDFIQSEPFGILAGSVMVLGLFIIAAGVAVIVQRFTD
ncbi:MAG TPA: hypothetical protein VNJ28_01745 [Candidatus Limnocylindrales bacterium]|nr:hypothetical protein [Candidatus Limnocylindrales bacterium]